MGCAPCALAATTYSRGFFPILAEHKPAPSTNGRCPDGYESGRGYCWEPKQASANMEPKSIRTVSAGKHRITVGCPKGQYQSKRCQVATQTIRVGHPRGEYR